MHYQERIELLFQFLIGRLDTAAGSAFGGRVICFNSS